MECYLYETTLIENITCKYKRLSRLRASYSLDVYIKPGVLIKDIIVRNKNTDKIQIEFFVS